MKARFRKTKDDIFGKLAEANLRKDYGAMEECCDELLNFSDEKISDELKNAICEIKTACASRNDEAIMQGFQTLVSIDGGQSETSEKTEMYTSKVADAIKKKDLTTARQVSKEFSEKTKDALEALGKPRLSDDFLFELIKANNEGKTDKVRKMLKKIPK